jgi:AcrR family transcriptional regulator
MTDTEFDTALITAAFRLAGDEGWQRMTVAAAAKAAGLPLSEARVRFPSRASVLLGFGRIADQAALLDVAENGTVRDRLFDLLMRRFDVLQAHRDGVKAVLRAAPADPFMAALLARATRRSMRWMLQAAGVTATGARGALQVQGLVAVWLWGVRAWERDESPDLTATMAAVDTALGRAETVANWLLRTKPQAEPGVIDGVAEAAEPAPETPPDP